jgi:ACS family tartrate transporter-like MFS transporter
MLPPLLGLTGQLFVGWSSDRHKERRYHAVVPIIIGACAIGLAPLTQGTLWLTVLCFMVAFAGFKAYMPAFWSMPSLFLTEAAAAGSIGLINSIGNLGGFLGPTVLGAVEKSTGSFAGGLYYLCGSMLVSAGIIFFLGLGHREKAEH